MFHCPQRVDFLWLHAKKFLERGCGVWFCAGDFDVGKFPQMRVHHTRRSLLEEKLAIALDGEREEMPRRGRLALAEIRQFVHAALLERHAEFFHRTNQALRIARRADERAEFHQ